MDEQLVGQQLRALVVDKRPNDRSERCVACVHPAPQRRNGIRVEVFSVGFGPELFGFTDKVGTRWKFSAIPLGGYVKMFGEASLETHQDVVMTADQKA